jgi:hypothetical protein
VRSSVISDTVAVTVGSCVSEQQRQREQLVDLTAVRCVWSFPHFPLIKDLEFSVSHSREDVRFFLQASHDPLMKRPRNEQHRGLLKGVVGAGGGGDSGDASHARG